MKELWEIFKEFDINNIWGLIIISIFLIVIFVSCIKPFYASAIEVLFMSEAEVLKRNSLVCVIIFIAFGGINYTIASSVDFVVVGALLLCLLLFLLFILWIIEKWSKFIKHYFFVPKYKESISCWIIIIFFPLVTFVFSRKNSINLMSCAVISTLLETLIIALCFLNFDKKESKIVLRVFNTKWYVFRKVDKYLLCGNEKNIYSSNKIRLFEIKTVIKEGYCFEKDIS